MEEEEEEDDVVGSLTSGVWLKKGMEMSIMGSGGSLLLRYDDVSRQFHIPESKGKALMSVG